MDGILTVVLQDGGRVRRDVSVKNTRSLATSAAVTARDGVHHEGTYYPPHQIKRVDYELIPEKEGEE